MGEINEKNKGPRVRVLRAIKLKDHPINRQTIVIPLKETFGFMPERIIVSKVSGENNKIEVMAVLTKEEEMKEDAIIKAQEKEKANVKKVLEDAQKRVKNAKTK